MRTKKCNFAEKTAASKQNGLILDQIRDKESLVESWGMPMRSQINAENDQCIFAVVWVVGRVRKKQPEIGHFEGVAFLPGEQFS